MGNRATRLVRRNLVHFVPAFAKGFHPALDMDGAGIADERNSHRGGFQMVAMEKDMNQ